MNGFVLFCTHFSYIEICIDTTPEVHFSFFIFHFSILILGSFFAAWWQFNKQLRLIGCITIYLSCSLKKIIEGDKYVWGKTTILFAILQAISQKLKKIEKIFTDGEWKETNKKLGKLFGNMKWM